MGPGIWWIIQYSSKLVTNAYQLDRVGSIIFQCLQYKMTLVFSVYKINIMVYYVFCQVSIH